MGTRLAEETTLKPKPMVEIGERPILWHIMKNLSVWGVREYVIALGYKGDEVKRFFLDYQRSLGSVSIDFSTGDVVSRDKGLETWLLHLVETGLTTQTGGRIKRAAPWIGGRTFLATYGDGLANVDLAKLIAFHRGHGKLATVTAVRPPARFGGLEFVGDRVAQFLEKPQTGEGWINGGYFVLEPGVIDFISDDNSVWEREPLEAIAAAGELMAFRHEGFFQPMDTIRDRKLLQDLWASEKAPWMNWI